LTELAFDLAYAWQLDPDAVLSKSLSRFNLFVIQAKRISERQQENGG